MTAATVTRRAVLAEWTKLRSLPSNAWLLFSSAAATVAFSAFLAAVGHTDATRAGQGDDDIVANGLRGVYVGQILVAVLAVMTIAAEYATGTIRPTLAANPRRLVVLAAKTAVVALVVFVVAVVASSISFLVAQPLLHRAGFVPPAYPVVSFADGSSLRAILGTALFLTAVAVLSIGVGTILRQTPAAVTTMIGLLLVPVVLAAAPLPASIQRLGTQVTPAAGLAIQSTRSDIDAPIGPWGGLAVTTAWAAVSLVVATWLIRRRDA